MMSFKSFLKKELGLSLDDYMMFDAMDRMAIDDEYEMYLASVLDGDAG